MAPPTDDVIQTIRTAAKRLTGHRRRRFQAETAAVHCHSSARRPEVAFGWGHDAVATGLHERRTGVRCLDACRLHGRKKTEDRRPELEDHIWRLADPLAQADPKVQSAMAFTRVTANAVRDALLARPELTGRVPCRQTVDNMLNRLGYRLQPVLKARPEKKSPRPTPSSETFGTPARGGRTGHPKNLPRHQGQGQSRRLFPRRRPRRPSTTTCPPTPCWCHRAFWN